MVLLVNLGLGAIALWLAVLLTAGELGGWTHLLVLIAFAAWGFAAGRALRRRMALRLETEGAEYGQEDSHERKR